MGAGESSLFSWDILAIPLILLATVAGLFLLVRYWQGKTHRDLKDLRAELRRFQTSRRELAQAAEEHSVEDPEPYGSRMAALHALLDRIGGELHLLEQQLVAIHERTHYLNTRTWQVLAGGPYFWFVLRREIGDLRQHLASLHAELASASEVRQALAHLGWDVAQDARQVQGLHAQASALLEGFRSRGIRGARMEAAQRQEAGTRAALSSLAPYFLKAEEAEVLAQADKDSIARAYQVVTEHRPRLEELLASAQAWDKDYQAAVEQVGAARQRLASLETSLAEGPLGLDLAGLQAQFNQLQIIGQNLSATLSRLEVESVGEVIKEAGRVARKAQEGETHLRQVRQQLTSLEALLPELLGGLKGLSGQFAALGTSASRPVAWNKSRPLLTRLSKEASVLSPVKRTRTPEQVSQEMALATELDRQQKELAASFQRVAEQHAELLTLLASQEIKEGVEWCRLAYRGAERALAYDPENWPRSDNVSTLRDDLRSMAERLQRSLAGRDPAEQIEEQEVGPCLEETRLLVRDFQALQGRVASIDARLAQVQQDERLASEQVEAARAAFTQMAFLVRSNDLLTEIAAQDAARLQKELQSANDELEQRGRGTIDKKVRQAAAVAARVEADGNRWLERLNQAIDTEAKELAASLAALDEIASFEEQALADARRVLASAGVVSGGQRRQMALGELVAELKRRSDAWQSLGASLNAVQDLQAHVTEAFTAANENRRLAKEMFAEVSTWMRTNRHWPPTSVTLTSERQELARAEEQWERLKSQPARAITLVGQFSSLAARYQAAGEKVSQAAQQADQEQSQVEGIENELAELLQLWQNQSQTYRDNPAAAEEIRKLLDELEQGLSNLKRQYRQGQKNYEQVLAGLKVLQRRARTAQISVDDAHVIDVNGRLIAFH